MVVNTTEAAEVCGLTPAGFRREMSRQRAKGVDLRTPAGTWAYRDRPEWDEARLQEWVATRPGKGNWK